ncbi:LacI family DNA-binding transcriptional regulator [Salsuginibacillus kocurii]|uniref:LacI family DNA-binding transcriptional regulator n=1 Tax=Salsuginibacillus kocurii TaxID=427078 RepID=UPI0003612C55|nr:LacI family DNA-binding transcriptional regulator [Salsuginibacillus kocurii]
MSSIKEVAKEANVSTATVSHVLNETRYVAEETKMKVYAAMQRLNYQPNRVARSLRSRKSYTIGLIVPLVADDTSNFFFMSIANSIEKYLKEKGYNLILSNSDEQFETEREQVEVFNAQFIDGLIMAPVNGAGKNYEDAFSEDYPVVFIDRKPKSWGGDTVLVNNYQATFEAVSALVAKGHEQIGLISGTLGITTSNDRLEGYKAALMHHHLSINNELIREAPATLNDGYRLTAELYNKGVTAIFIANNVMTMGAVSYLQEHRVPIPDQIAIIGYDDYDWMRIVSPPLSVVRQPAHEIGKAAVNQLLKRIHGDQASAYEEWLEAELVIRGSI